MFWTARSISKYLPNPNGRLYSRHKSWTLTYPQLWHVTSHVPSAHVQAPFSTQTVSIKLVLCVRRWSIGEKRLRREKSSTCAKSKSFGDITCCPTITKYYIHKQIKYERRQTVMFGGDKERSQIVKIIGSRRFSKTNLITKLFVSLQSTNDKIDGRWTNTWLNKETNTLTCQFNPRRLGVKGCHNSVFNF